MLNSVAHKGLITHQNGDAGDLLIACADCQDVFVGANLDGTLVAPKGRVNLATVASGHTGSFFARDLDVAANTTVRHQAFRHWYLLQSPNCEPSPDSENNDEFGYYVMCGDGEMEVLPPPIRAEDSQALINSFRWSDTVPVPNFSGGVPTLYYALIYLDNKVDLEALDELQIHYDALPLFAEERDKWAGMEGAMGSSFDGVGGFVYAVIPGITYNLIREAALCTDPSLAQELFKAVKILDVPVSEARNSDGSLSYDYLSAEGFRYRGLPNCPDTEMPGADSDDPEGLCDSPFLDATPESDPLLKALMEAPTGSGTSLACSALEDDGTSSGQVVQPWGLGLGKLVKKVAKKVVKVVKGGVDLARKGLATASRWFKGSAYLTVNLEMRNINPAFGAKRTLMVRSWGKKRGQPLPLGGVQIRVMQQITFKTRVKIPSVKIGGTGFKTPKIVVPIKGKIPFDALSTGTADAEGSARIKVVKRSTTGVCIRLDNAAGVVENWVLEQEVCSFKNPILSASQLNGNVTKSVPISNSFANILVQVSDGYSYLTDVAQYKPKKAHILVGKTTKVFSSDGRAYAPCFGFPNWQNPYAALLGRIGELGGQQIGKKYVEPTILTFAQTASESLDALANSTDLWASALQNAANSAAETTVRNAWSATASARDAASVSTQAAAAAADAAASLTEAANRLVRLRDSGAAKADIDRASQQVEHAASEAASLTQIAKTAAETAATATQAAVVASATAVAAVAGTVVATGANAAADALRVGDALAQAAVKSGAEGVTTALGVAGKAAGTVLGAIVGELADIVLSDVDIVMPSGESSKSRGVPTHEYGHFVLCDMMYRTSPFQFGSAWTKTLSDTVAKQALGLDASGDDHVYINEAWADAFAAQVAGGVNYFQPVGSKFAEAGSNQEMAWCTNVRCVEDNFGAGNVSTIPGTSVLKQVSDVGDMFHEQVARVASILHDAFDGRINPPLGSSTTDNLPGNGAAWIYDEGLPGKQSFRAPASASEFSENLANFFNPVGSLDDTPAPEKPNAGVIHEESIAIPGAALPNIVREWLRREPPLAALRQDTFFKGLTDVMLGYAYPDEVCRLYVLHQPTDTCPSWGPSGSENAPPPPFYICPPGTKLSAGILRS
ncbi:MAG: hypothetical protein QM784_09785 [Polyangiaceae bacterium]